MKTIKTKQLIYLYLLNYMIKIEEINQKFNEELLRQIEGSLPKDHTYQLGLPSAILQSVQIPDLMIELRASRLSDKAIQIEHPFDLQEIIDLPKVIHNPLAIFRSATHLKHYVIMTELEHDNKNFIIVLQKNRCKKNNEINDIRSIYPKDNRQVINWINETLLEFANKQKMTEWLFKQRSNSAEVKKPFSRTFYSSKQRYNSAEVRKLLNHAAKIVQNFENTNIKQNFNN
jgi:hypothetical protein